MSNLHPVFEQALRPFVPRFERTSCSQCGHDTGPGDAGHSSCKTHQLPVAPDLSDLYAYEYETSTGLCLRCYLEHEPAIDGGDAHPDEPECITLVYAYAGLIDISEVLAKDVIDTIEEEALTDLQRKAKGSHDDASIERYLDRVECEA